MVNTLAYGETDSKSSRRATHTRVAMTKPRVADQPFVDEVPRLLAERGWSLRRLAREAGVSASHLSRVIRRAQYKTPSVSLMERVARALDLPGDYFIEVRESLVMERIRGDAKLREELYRRLAPPRRR